MTIATFVLAAMTLLAPGRDHQELAGSITRVVESEPPLPGRDRRATAALVVAIAFRESTFKNDTVSATNDHCAMQIHARPELRRDVDACIRVGLAMLRASFRVCPAHPIAFYAVGPTGCTNARGQRISRDRVALAAHLVRKVKDP